MSNGFTSSVKTDDVSRLLACLNLYVSYIYIYISIIDILYIIYRNLRRGSSKVLSVHDNRKVVVTYRCLTYLYIAKVTVNVGLLMSSSTNLKQPIHWVLIPIGDLSLVNNTKGLNRSPINQDPDCGLNENIDCNALVYVSHVYM